MGSKTKLTKKEAIRKINIAMYLIREGRIVDAFFELNYLKENLENKK